MDIKFEKKISFSHCAIVDRILFIVSTAMR